jgi:DNA-binding response OmpR family regulator
MNSKKRDQIRRTLRNMAAAHASMIDFMEQALSLLNEELALDPVTFWHSHKSGGAATSSAKLPSVDRDSFSIRFRGKECFLGNTLPFRLFERLMHQANTYVAYEELLTDVWDGVRSDEAVRSVVKRLRATLRHGGMPELATAIDGSVVGHYALNLER